MHPFDDAETVTLEVIDATLAGEAVEPEYAELAELTLILAGQRPAPSIEFASGLDARVARRFSSTPAVGARRARRWWLYTPGIAFAAAAAVAIVVAIGAGHGTGQSSASSSSAASFAAAGSATGHTRSALPNSALTPASRTAKSSSASSSAGSASAPGAILSPPAGAPAPSTAGRQVVQSAQLALSTRPSHVDDVAQQVFDVIAAQNGVVENSQVTATNNASGYAQFRLSVPSSNLSQTMSELSKLHGAAVVSRTDATQDITGQVGAAGRALADARALRTSLLRQLQNATTTTAIDSLKAQLRNAEAAISSDLAQLNGLHRQVDFSQISLTINALMVPPVHPVSSGGSFTIGKAAHDAGRVLVVAAGVGLIALAVLVPLAMVAGVALWVAFAIRRRRREQALDLV